MPGSVWGERTKKEKKPRNDEETGRKGEKRKKKAPERGESGAKGREKEEKSPRARKKRGIEKQNE